MKLARGSPVRVAFRVVAAERPAISGHPGVSHRNLVTLQGGPRYTQQGRTYRSRNRLVLEPASRPIQNRAGRFALPNRIRSSRRRSQAQRREGGSNHDDSAAPARNDSDPGAGPGGRSELASEDTRNEGSMNRLGYQIPNFTYPGVAPGAIFDNVVAQAKAAEAAGYDRVFVMDHFYQLPGIGAPEEPMFECYAMLSALAQHTESVRLSALVTGNTYRNPTLLAKTITTLDHVSHGASHAGDRFRLVPGRARRPGLPIRQLHRAFREARRSASDHRADASQRAAKPRWEVLQGRRCREFSRALVEDPHHDRWLGEKKTFGWSPSTRMSRT